MSLKSIHNSKAKRFAIKRKSLNFWKLEKEIRWGREDFKWIGGHLLAEFIDSVKNVWIVRLINCLSQLKDNVLPKQMSSAVICGDLLAEKWGKDIWQPDYVILVANCFICRFLPFYGFDLWALRDKLCTRSAKAWPLYWPFWPKWSKAEWRK